MKSGKTIKTECRSNKRATEIVVSNSKEFFEFLNMCVDSSENVLYRGLKRWSYRLVPSIGRVRQKNSDAFTSDRERLMLKLFKQKAHGLFDVGLADLAILTIAQHHGLPTRLMDWTRNPLVAFYFAVRTEFLEIERPEDSVVYCYYPEKKVDLDLEFDPFSLTSVRRFVPRFWNPRIVAQNGLFTIHPNPERLFQPKRMLKVRVVEGFRRDLKLTLHNLGVNCGALFPDMDGIAKHIEWLRTDAF